MSKYPQISKKICTKCGLCITDCVSRAIDSEKYEIIEHKCIDCGHCIAICPVEAVVKEGLVSEKRKKPTESMAQQLEDLIKMRRSVRHYKEVEVEKELIHKITDATVHSPTGTNSRLTGITVIHSKEKIRELSDILMHHFQRVTRLLLNPLTYPLLILILGSKKTKKIFAYKKLIPRYFKGKNILTHDAPLLMLFHSHKKASTPDQDALIWSTTAMYTAESLGLGTCFNGFLVIGINSCKKARKFIGLKKNHKIYETFTAGFPKFEYQRTVARKTDCVTFLQ